MQATYTSNQKTASNEKLDAAIELINSFDVCRLIVAQAEISVPAKEEENQDWEKFTQNLFIADGNHSLGELYCVARRELIVNTNT